MGTESMIPHSDRPLELGLCRTPADVADALRRAATRYRTDADGIYEGPAWERVAAALDGAAEALALEPIDPAAIRWDSHAREPVALLLLDFGRNGPGGTTIVRRDSDGSLHGCRDVSPGPGHDPCVAAWIAAELRNGVKVEDRRARMATLAAAQAAAIRGLVEALAPFAERRHSLINGACHAGICSVDECARCTRATRATAAIEWASILLGVPS